MIKDKDKKRLLDNLIPIPESGCWLWEKYVNHDGYGKIQIKDQFRLVHRVMWESVNGPIPEGMCVCHKCDVRSCANPNHLFIGTHTDNVRDMYKKGRWERKDDQNGENNRSSKLKRWEVERIRELYKTNKYTHKQLGRMFNTSRTNIGLILSGKRWKST